MRCRGSQQPKLSKYIVLPWYNNAPVPNRRSFVGKTDKICPKTSKMLLAVPKTKTMLYGDRSFAARAPRLWNALPVDVKKKTPVLLVL